MAAEVMYEAADPYSRKLFIDRGQTQGVALGAPVINDAGVLGQVTRLYPLTSEVTLLTDKDAAIPVLNTRTQQRSAAFGGVALASGGAMELRFLSGNADVKPGDTLVTSGLDGVYPPGLPVARVSSVERRAESGFARILLEPAARADGGAPRAGARTGRPAAASAARARARRTPARPAAGRQGAAQMIMPRGSDQLLLPVNPLFIGFTLLVALGFNLLPWAATRRCPTCWRWCWCSGTCTSRAAWAWAWPSSSGC
jgi:rod shape-determining protein MreC